jgi:hypothetical protein
MDPTVIERMRRYRARKRGEDVPKRKSGPPAGRIVVRDGLKAGVSVTQPKSNDPVKKSVQTVTGAGMVEGVSVVESGLEVSGTTVRVAEPVTAEIVTADGVAEAVPEVVEEPAPTTEAGIPEAAQETVEEAGIPEPEPPPAWLPYGDLASTMNIKRGWLDNRVGKGLVKVDPKGLYKREDVERELKADPEQVRR